MVIAIEVMTDELCITAVSTAPIRTRSTGLLITARKFLSSSEAANASIDPLISDSPTKIMPKPAIMPPILRMLSLFANASTNAPIPANAANITEVEIEFPNIPSATICPVIVVPIFAPKMTVAACASDITPALTKPMTITVVADELCIAAVVTVPTPTPTSLLFEAFANSAFSFLLPSDSRFELIILHAIKNTPTPAISVSMELAIVLASIKTSP